jgi:hypothetical protein
LAAAPAAAVDPCTLPNAQVASEDGIGGTGVSGEEDGIGGSGHSGGEDGVGGTGFANADGIGGTGLSGDDGVRGTGIWGTITNFGSICVNGLRVQYDQKTLILRNGQPAEAAALHRGQVVWIEATAQASGLVANRISAVSAAIGRLGSVDGSTRRFSVGQQTVWAPRGIAWAGLPADAEANFAALQPGDTVDVSGLRTADGTIVATRIVRSSETEPDYEGPRLATLVRNSPRVKQLSIEGFRGQEGTEHAPRVAGITVEGARLRRLTPESRVWIAGPRQGVAGMNARKVLYRPLQRPTAKRLRNEDAQLSRAQIGENQGPQVIETGTPLTAPAPTLDGMPKPGDTRIVPTAIKHSGTSIDRNSSPAAKPETLRQVDRPQKIDRSLKVERPQRIDRPLMVERPARIERPERIERPPAIK